MARPFKLEAVLNHRRHREEAARKRYADAVRQLRQQQEQLTDIQMTRQKCRQDLRGQQRSGVAATQIIMYMHYLARLDTEIQAQDKVVQTHRREKEKQRQALLAALKDRKVIEKLKEHHLSQLEVEEREREQKLLNDVAITRYHAQRKETLNRRQNLPQGGKSFPMNGYGRPMPYAFDGDPTGKGNPPGAILSENNTTGLVMHIDSREYSERNGMKPALCMSQGQPMMKDE